MRIGSSVKSNLIGKWIIIFHIVLATLVFISCNTSDFSEVFTFSGNTMGTTYSIKIVESANFSLPSNLHKEIDSVLAEVNNQMSTYIKDSEISLFNSNKDTNWVKISSALAEVMNEAKNISAESDNVYDITIGPVVNLWGFGPENDLIVIPTDAEINLAKDKTGTEKLKVNLSKLLIKKTDKDLYCDLSSIAKGFGVDKVGLLLENCNLNNYMVEIGGEVRTKGKKNKNENWKIGISTPISNGLQKVLLITNVSVATSGDYLNYFEREGVRYSHLIDPRDGKPITHNLASVTVVHSNCRTADAYATAINVMGPTVGYEFALKKKLPIFMIVRENNSFVEKMTPQFEEYIYERE